jgi:hypothetical protein
MTILDNNLYYYGGLWYEGVGLGSHLACGIVWPPGDVISEATKRKWRSFKMTVAEEV